MYFCNLAQDKILCFEFGLAGTNSICFLSCGMSGIQTFFLIPNPNPREAHPHLANRPLPASQSLPHMKSRLPIGIT